MTENYLQIMIESLEKKLMALDSIEEINAKQFECSSARPFNAEKYNEIMEEKGKIIDEINALDDGFTSTYELVREDVQANPQVYKDKVLKLQELVKQTVDKGVSVEAQEKRNKASMETAISTRRQEFRKQKVSTAVAMKYYKSTNRINNVDPQLMDRKK
jgi:hypothetical protein